MRRWLTVLLLLAASTLSMAFAVQARAESGCHKAPPPKQIVGITPAED